MDVEQFIESFVWDEGVALDTSRGPKILLTAPYDKTARGFFFKYWKQYKIILKNAGISCAPDKDGQYNTIKLWLPHNNDKQLAREQGIEKFNTVFRKCVNEEDDEGDWE